MCGITGLFEYKTQEVASEETLRKMTASLAHRGPDGEGIWRSGPIGLGHRRLSIIDLSENGAQPMPILGEEIVITYNGELYNYKELRERLIEKGRRFRSDSDTEVLAHAYSQWGADCLKELSGIFAFAIWDARKQTLFLARDPLGVKPLFYSIDAQSFRFGSEVKAVLCDPRVSREFSDEGLDAYFSFSYCPAPLTGLRDLCQIPPGHYATVNREGMKETRYWTIPYQDKPDPRPFEALKEEFDDLLQRVVKRQTVSDVPIGVFVSGGLDSTALASALTRSGCSETKAFSAGFSESSFNELPFARQVAQGLEIDLEEQILDLNAIELLPEISRFMDEPTADSSMIPVFLLSKMTAAQRKVVLSGDGADEILAGYETYRANHFARYYRALPAALRKHLIEPLVRRIPATDSKYSLHQIANRFIQGAAAGSGRDHCSWRLIFDDSLKQRLYSKDFRARIQEYDAVGRYASALNGAPASFGPLASYLHADTTFYLPNDMLVKVDRMSMANSLEVRVPFLDTEMVAFCANLPPEAKLRRGKIRKHILRESLRGRFSNRLLDRPKSGFNIPVEAWMRQKEMRSLLLDTVGKNATPISDYFQIQQIEEIWKEHAQRRADYGHALFSILMFALWCDTQKQSQ